jgi:hypothetical protein
MNKINLAFFGLAIDTPLAIPSNANFRPPHWPPPPDWPVMINKEGKIISRWGDSIWRLDPWAKKSLSLNFGDGRVMNTEPIDAGNANLLRQIAGLWIWGANGVRTCNTLQQRFSCIRQIFVICSLEGILASDLMRFPAVADQISKVIAPSQADVALTWLHYLYDQRDTLGFILLDKNGLARLATQLPEHESLQHAYIPPRIWTYQVTRLRECLDDFLAHQSKFEACFQFCLDAYANNYGSLSSVLSNPSQKYSGRSPFTTQTTCNGEISGAQFHGPFEKTAANFGIDQLLRRWVGLNDDNESFAVDVLTSYMNLISRVGLAYILNFSLMRVDEGFNLRENCLYIEHDSKFGDIYVLRGETTKTIDDSNALWPTSPSVKIAINAMNAIANINMTCAIAHPNFINKDYLIDRFYAPWIKVVRKIGLDNRPRQSSYLNSLLTPYPKLFDLNELRITEHDLQIARLITPNLDPERYAVGEPWKFSWHQLRRTGSVNMQASGLVSDASLQYQLKHVTRSCSLYYGQGYSRLNLNDEARTLYLRTMYEVLGKEFAQLLTDRFISPHGEKRKTEIVQLISTQDAKKLTSLAKGGRLMLRDIMFGLCMKKGPCQYGGIDSVAHCGGSGRAKACADVLYDKTKMVQVLKLNGLIDKRLAEAPLESPLYESLEAQKQSVRNYLNVIETS